jgi:hypothetical protein
MERQSSGVRCTMSAAVLRATRCTVTDRQTQEKRFEIEHTARMGQSCSSFQTWEKVEIGEHGRETAASKHCVAPLASDFLQRKKRLLCHINVLDIQKLGTQIRNCILDLNLDPCGITWDESVMHAEGGP